MSGRGLLQMSGIVIDLVYRVAQVPKAGEDALAESCMITPGGGFNAMVAAKRAGMDVTYGGAHGTGLFADLVRQGLGRAGIPLLQPPSSFADQGSCVVAVDDQGERTFISKDGAEGILDPRLLEPINPSAFDWVLLSGYALASAGGRDALFNWLRSLPRRANFVFDPSPAVKRIAAPCLRLAVSKANWISANEIEATAMTGVAPVEQAAASLAAMLSGDGRGAVVRCGAEGCWLALRGEPAVYLPGFVVNSVDTNGAGDAHIGAFVAALAKSVPPVEAARYANAAAALSTLRRGSATAPNDLETRDFLGQQLARAQSAAARGFAV